MTRGQRLTFLGIAAVIAVVAVIVLAGSGGETDGSSKSARTPSPTATAGDGTATATPIPTPLLRAGAVKALTVHQGDTVRFRVRSPKREEVHIHGYDIKKDLPAGKTVDVAFKAGITGIFEIELEDSGMQLASLKVLP